MNKKNTMSFIKKMAALVIAVGMVVTGIVLAPKQADAEGNVIIPDKVIYESYQDAKTYWEAEPKKAPMKDGYVFGGWFKEVLESEKTENTETSVENSGTVYYEPLTEVTGEAFAKFVPAQVLSIKAQNGVDEGKEPITKAEDISKENPMWIRVMTSLDSKNYDWIGFDIYLANRKQPTNSADGTKVLRTKKVFSGLYEGDNTEPTAASDIFCGASNYVCVWKLDQIDTASNAEKIIYVRPYWVTKDGTTVNGLAKYVHIEDEYKGYISVPVNIARTEDVAAGTIDMSYYGYDGLQIAKDDNDNILFEEGRIFPEMTFRHDATNKEIKMVGVEQDANTYKNSNETIYANIRFQKPTTDTSLNFDMKLVKFCNWEEKTDIDVKVWDIVYEIKTTNE